MSNWKVEKRMEKEGGREGVIEKEKRGREGG